MAGTALLSCRLPGVWISRHALSFCPRSPKRLHSGTLTPARRSAIAANHAKAAPGSPDAPRCHLLGSSGLPDPFNSVPQAHYDHSQQWHATGSMPMAPPLKTSASAWPFHNPARHQHGHPCGLVGVQTETPTLAPCAQGFQSSMQGSTDAPCRAP